MPAHHLVGLSEAFSLAVTTLILLEFCFFFSEVRAKTLSSSSEMYEYTLKVTGFDYFIVNNTQKRP